MTRLQHPLSVLLVAIGLTANVSPQQATFKTSIDVVSIPVTVLQGGRPVQGMDVTDFVLTDNDVKQDIELLGGQALAVDVTVISVGVPMSRQDQLRQAFIEAGQVNALLRPDDRLRVLSAGDTVHEIRPMNDVSGALPSVRYDVTYGAALNDALFQALVWPAAPDRRHLIVVLTFGQDTWSTLESSRLVPVARRSDAVVYVALLSKESNSMIAPDVSKRWQESVSHLTAVTSQTGGDVYELTDVTSAIARALSSFRTTYLLRYSPQGVAADGWHAVSVTAPRRAGVSIRARKGYEKTSR